MKCIYKKMDELAMKALESRVKNNGTLKALDEALFTSVPMPGPNAREGGLLADASYGERLTTPMVRRRVMRTKSDSMADSGVLRRRSWN